VIPAMTCITSVPVTASRPKKKMVMPEAVTVASTRHFAGSELTKPAKPIWPPRKAARAAP
jgi:hypothetical protein